MSKLQTMILIGLSFLTIISCTHVDTMWTQEGCVDEEILCQHNGNEYSTGEKFSAGDACNQCMCNPNGDRPGEVECTAIACLKTCSGILGNCELNSHVDCPEFFPKEGESCSFNQRVDCYECGFIPESSFATTASCQDGIWEIGRFACGD